MNRQPMKSLIVKQGDEEKEVAFPQFFVDDFHELQRQESLSDIDFPIQKIRPVLNERFVQKRRPEPHYFYQDLWVAQKIYLNHPKIHVDVGSRIEGFVSHVASFRQIIVADIRKTPFNVPNVHFIEADFMNEIDQSLYNYCDSISSLHVLEHFGLGRYGDRIDCKGYLWGLNNIYHMLKKGGTFYFSVPIGPQRVEFNAHRVFSLSYLMELFQDGYTLKSFSYENEEGDFFENILPTRSMIDSNCGCNYGCAVFEWIKR